MKNRPIEDRSRCSDRKRAPDGWALEAGGPGPDLGQIDDGVALLGAYEMEFGELASALRRLPIPGR